LWVNTAALALGSVALQFARGAARRGELGELRSDLLAGGASALAFLAGQLMAWHQLADAGYYLATNPANAFFYMLTALHGLHLAGGIVALGWVTAKAWRGGDRIERLRVSIDLCAVYWHFMLFVWLVLLVVLAGWAGDFIEMCRQLVS
jgi:cytochrome c oxidase subunit III